MILKRRTPSDLEHLREVLRVGDPAAIGGPTADEIARMRSRVVDAGRRRLSETPQNRPPSLAASLARFGHGMRRRPALVVALGTTATVLAVSMLARVAWRNGAGSRPRPNEPALSTRGEASSEGPAGARRDGSASVRSASEAGTPPVVGDGAAVPEGAAPSGGSRIAAMNPSMKPPGPAGPDRRPDRSDSLEVPAASARAAPRAGHSADGPELTASRREGTPPITGSRRGTVGSRSGSRIYGPVQPDFARDGPRFSRAADAEGARPPRRIELTTESGRRIIWILNPDLSL